MLMVLVHVLGWGKYHFFIQLTLFGRWKLKKPRSKHPRINSKHEPSNYSRNYNKSARRTQKPSKNLMKKSASKACKSEHQTNGKMNDGIHFKTSRRDAPKIRGLCLALPTHTAQKGSTAACYKTLRQIALTEKKLFPMYSSNILWSHGSYIIYQPITTIMNEYSLCCRSWFLGPSSLMFSTWRKKGGELSATRHTHFTQVQHHQWC